MSPLATLIVIVLAAALWFGVLRPRLRAGERRQEDAGELGAMSDGGRVHGHGEDGEADGGSGGDGGGDGD